MNGHSTAFHEYLLVLQGTKATKVKSQDRSETASKRRQVHTNARKPHQASLELFELYVHINVLTLNCTDPSQQRRCAERNCTEKPCISTCSSINSHFAHWQHDTLRPARADHKLVVGSALLYLSSCQPKRSAHMDGLQDLRTRCGKQAFAKLGLRR